MPRARTSRRTTRSARRPAPPHDRLEPRFLLTTLAVTSVADDGPGSLREAIEMANASTATPDVIRFDIPGDGLYRTITPLSPLPEVLGPLTIDGTTQPGYVGSPVVELNGSLAGSDADGLSLSAPQVVVRGLAINRFSRHGIAANAPRPASNGRPPTQGAVGAKIESNYIGTDVTGNLDLGNGGAGVMVAVTGVVIGVGPGLTTTTARNVISGNGFAGVWITDGGVGSPTVNNVSVNGDFIGTNAGGGRALGNDREGVLIEGSVGSVTVGGLLPLGQVHNVISGNAGSGIRVALGATVPTGTIAIQGNFIGTNAVGSAALGNGRSPLLPFRDGVTFAGRSLRLGGSPQDVTGRNVISGNAGNGVALYSGADVQVNGNYVGTDATGNADLGNGRDGVLVTGETFAQVTANSISGNGGGGVHALFNTRDLRIGGNSIGTNVAGTATLGNDGDGVQVENAGALVTIGGPSSLPQVTGRNIISGNGGNGISISSSISSSLGLPLPHSITGNFIGTDANATLALGNAGSGIYLSTPGAVIGGSPTTARNVICANGGDGITIVGPPAQQPPQTQGTRIEGNLIGVGLGLRGTADVSTDTGLGNRGNGVAIYYSSNNHVGAVGGPTGSGNRILFNGANGVLVQGQAVAVPQITNASAEGNLISGNAIYGNGELGIDLVRTGEGVTENDLLDADVGPNRLQNFPVITEAFLPTTSSTAQIRYELHSEPSKSYRIEFFASLAPDASGRGEGQVYLGGTTVTTDAGGNAAGTFSALVSLPLPTPRPANFVTMFTATATEGNRNTSEFSPAVRGSPTPPPVGILQSSAHVIGRYAFYDGSALQRDGGDDAAVATDKAAMLPGQAATFANVTGYSRGLNGVMVDVADLPATAMLTAADFAVRAADAPGATFHDASAPSSISVRRGEGVNGTTRVTLYWGDAAPVTNGWLEVRVRADDMTGLTAPDVFYFGNLVGDAGNSRGTSAGGFAVDASDLVRTRAAAAATDREAPLTSVFDPNRDGVVDAADVAIVRAAYGRRLDPFAPEPVVLAASTGRAYRPPTRLAVQVLT